MVGFVLLLPQWLDEARRLCQVEPRRITSRRQHYTACQSSVLWDNLAAPQGGGCQGEERETKQMQVR